MHLNVLKMKIFFEEHYFRFNRIILLTIGIWPYQQSKLASFQIAIISGILISNIVFQVYISIDIRKYNFIIVDFIYKSYILLK